MIHRHRPVTSLKSTEHDAEGAAGYLARAAISGSSRPKSARQPGRDAGVSGAASNDLYHTVSLEGSPSEMLRTKVQVIHAVSDLF